ncbi:BRCA1-associated protein [Coniophora puteana RWD-64-598 SS2]|uniref:BRCA1-associated protein n=1 Tax=Coniophora puteana (strain RWD-64-598) TaxID=741705 RepID=A0A5M3MKM7_CONPW|nr:BRCA1-associated protein [Coniophora puteana RWD-64-598 SS2]EIW79215.1 BRCA1-associated protein [Coniophora puteana RWD-64-598 SS2]
MRGYHIRIALQKETVFPSQFIPNSLFQQLPSHPPKSTARRNATFNPKHRDYRCGPVRIDWTDFDNMKPVATTAASKVKNATKTGGPARASFVETARTKAGSTNLPEGIVHIYRDAVEGPHNGQSSTDTSPNVNQSISEGGVMLAVLAVPSWMTPSDFLEFVEPAADSLVYLRIIHDFAPNRAMAVMRFREPAHAADFIEAYNGKPFNSIAPETCHVVRVLSVEIDTEDILSTAASRLGSTIPHTFELPTCPVCLERMDAAVTGLISVPCSHAFHCTCLRKWGDSRCPVCRYSQNLMTSHPSTSSSSSRPIPFSNPSSTSLSTCADCASTTNLWICLICGNIGCGRYGRAHAHAHYQQTTHLYALELETQRVWDYAGDGYVHRLIQNRADGKIVELPSAASSMGALPRDDGTLGPSHADSLSAEKIEAIGIEYSYLLTSQLDSQRQYYEEQTSHLNMQLEELQVSVARLSTEMERERVDYKQREELKRREHEEKIDGLIRDKLKAERKAEKATELARRFEKELKEERAVSEGLMKNVGKLKERTEQLDKQRQESEATIAELKDQVRDVMFFLEANSKIEQGGGAEAEAAGGSVELPQPTPGTPSKKKKAKKR